MLKGVLYLQRLSFGPCKMHYPLCYNSFYRPVAFPIVM